MKPEVAMDMSENLHEMVDRLGQALVLALATDPESMELARRIHDSGFNLSLLIEATGPRDGDAPDRDDDRGEASLDPWSEDDKALLRTFRIRLD